jgi:hypothetical protein
MEFAFIQIALVHHFIAINCELANFMPFVECSLKGYSSFEVNLDTRTMLILFLEVPVIYFVRIKVKKS